MKMRSFFSVLAVLAFSISVSVNAADVEWSGWSFDYSTNTNSSGLVLTNVDYNGDRIISKVSMPVVRVEYNNDVCGPYADILSSSRLRAANQGAPDSACDNQAVCQRTFTQGGEQKLEIGANWQIGEYQIYQTYYFSENGYIDSRVYSRGLQCQISHRHHAQWMFDFDIDDEANDRILKGDGAVQAVEFNDLRADTPYWTIEDTASGNKVRLIPSSDDGSPDNFSQWDAAGRLFKSSEVGRWTKGARGEIGDNWMSPPENINGQDLVMWYVSHLPHSASEGSSIWHASGPRVEVVSTATPPPAPPPAPPEPEPTGDNLLVNGGFDNVTPLAGWANCGDSSNTSVGTTAHQGANALAVTNGGCIYQEVAAEIAQEYTLTCQASRVGNQWSIIEFGFLDGNYETLASEARQISSGANFNAYQLTATAPENTVYALALVYSEDQVLLDTCSLVRDGAPPVTPEPTSNLLDNGSFESNTANWSSCAAADLLSVSNDADDGAAALAVNNGGCMYQEFPVAAGSSYQMQCRAKRTSSARYTSVSLTMMNASYNSLETSELPVTTSTFADYSATLTAPATGAVGSVVVYSEDPAVFDTCSVSVN